MRKIFTAAILFAVLTLAACGTRQPVAQDGKLHVVATVNALVEITRIIGGDRVTVTALVPDGTEIHDYEPTPRDAEAVADADLVVLNGLGLEPWFENSALSGTSAEICVATDDTGNTVIESGGVTDPHMWLSPICACDMATNVCNAMSALDPDNAEYYAANLGVLLDELSALFNEYQEKIAPGTVIVTAHEAFGYLCREFEITERSVRGIYADGEPSPRQLAELVTFCRENNVTRIYSEAAASADVAATLARECGAEVVAVYTMESAEDGLGYVERLRANLETIAG